MAQQALRIGCLGTGGFARKHLDIVAPMDGVTIAAVCGVDADRAAAVGRRYGAASYTDVTAMLDRERLDALYVAIPPSAHTGQELQAVERGIHLFVEKPVALDLDLAERTAAALEASGVIGAAGYHLRYLDTVQEVKQVVDPHDVALALGYWIDGLPGVAWWRRQDSSGGQIVEQTTHIFDLARYVLGEATSVGALGVRGHMADVPDYSVHDASVVTLRFDCGTIATITSSCLADYHSHIGLELVARDHWVEITPESVTYRTDGETRTVTPRVDPYLLENEVFLRAVRSGDLSEIRSTYADAVQSLRLTVAATAAMDSAEAGAV